MNKKYLSLLATIVMAICLFADVSSLGADEVRIWEADTGLGGITDKAKIGAYLDNLKAHSVNGLWVQVELYRDGEVNYKKTTLSKLPTAQKFKTGQWASDDFLSYVTSQAKSRGMKVMIKFHGSNHVAWDQHKDWRKRDSKGKEVLWSGTLKNFCVNSPYWNTMFLPMVKEIAQNYDVDGFYLDTCQVAPGGTDACFCQYCKARFQKETGKTLPLKPVDIANWTDSSVKQYAVKRVEWVNGLYEQYAQAIREIKPASEILLNTSGGYNSYKDGTSARHLGKYVTTMTSEPVNTPRMYAVTKNRELVKAKQKPRSESELALDEIVPSLNRYGYNEFSTKLTMADGGFKPTVPISRFWFTDDQSGMASTDMAIKEIESSIGAGAKGWCFFGYLAHAMETGAAKKGAWADPKFAAYLKDLSTGPRSKWIADMQPDSRIGILVDRDKDFWTGGYWKRFQDIGRLYSFIQYQRKLSVGLVATSEPAVPGLGQTGYKLTKDLLKQYTLLICPGLDYVSVEDLQSLKEYVDEGGKLIIMGSVGRRGKFLGGSATDDAYRLLGLTTIGDPVPSGFIKPTNAKHPVFMMVILDKSTGTFRYAADKEDALSCEVKFSDAFDIWAYEYGDNGKRPAILYTKDSRHDPVRGAICYINTDNMHDCTSGMLMVLMNMLVIVPAKTDAVFPSHFSETASVNVFKSADNLTRYIHVSTLEGETSEYFRIRANPNMYPISVEIITNGGEPKTIPIIVSGREPNPGEMIIAPRGNGILKPGALPPGFTMLKIAYEHREFPTPGQPSSPTSPSVPVPTPPTSQ